jgi:hypothetical protein
MEKLLFGILAYNLYRGKGRSWAIGDNIPVQSTVNKHDGIMEMEPLTRQRRELNAWWTNVTTNRRRFSEKSDVVASISHPLNFKRCESSDASPHLRLTTGQDLTPKIIIVLTFRKVYS